MVYQDGVEFHYLNVGLPGVMRQGIVVPAPSPVFQKTNLRAFWKLMCTALIGNLFQIDDETPELTKMRKFTLSWWSEHGSGPVCDVSDFVEQIREQDTDTSMSRVWDIMLLASQQWTESLLSDAHRRISEENTDTRYAMEIRESPVYE
jgi:hypothetical protein